MRVDTTVFVRVGCTVGIGVFAFATAMTSSARAEEMTVTVVEEDGSAVTTHDGLEHTAPEGPGRTREASTGALTPVGPFVGDKSEGFTTQTTGASNCVIERVFDNMADLCSTGGCLIVTDSWAFSCTIVSNNTPRLAGSCNGYSVYTFDMPISAFGGYFGSNAQGPVTGTARFYNGDLLLDTVDIAIEPGCAWAWSGWEAPDAIITRVEIESDVFGGAFVQMDDMEVIFGDPTPVIDATWGRIKTKYADR